MNMWIPLRVLIAEERVGGSGLVTYKCRGHKGGCLGFCFKRETGSKGRG